MLRHVRVLSWVLALASSAFGVACAETKPPATNLGVRAAIAAPARPRVSAPISQQATSDIHISDEIRSKCGISDADAYFAFNSALITSHDKTPLDLVLRCFTSGPLTGHTMRLVGRADPRGQPEYNLTLGQYRADAVEVYLTSRGLRRDKASSTTRGAMDAVGTDETTWQHDRRVDILLAD